MNCLEYFKENGIEEIYNFNYGHSTEIFELFRDYELVDKIPEKLDTPETVHYIKKLSETIVIFGIDIREYNIEQLRVIEGGENFMGWVIHIVTLKRLGYYKKL